MDTNESGGDEFDVLLGDLREYLREKRKQRMGKYRPQVEKVEHAHASGDEKEAMPEECKTGRCEHPEHASDDDLDALLG